MGQNLVPLVNKIAGKWMFIPLKMVLIGIDPYPYTEGLVIADVHSLKKSIGLKLRFFWLNCRWKILAVWTVCLLVVCLFSKHVTCAIIIGTRVPTIKKTTSCGDW